MVLFIDYAMHSKENLIFSILISNEMQIWKIGEVVMPTAGVLERREGSRILLLKLQTVNKISLKTSLCTIYLVNSENLVLHLQPPS